MIKRFFLVTAFGKDRPGMVAEVTRMVYQQGGNIHDASMTRLGGEFTMMLVVDLPSSDKAVELFTKPGLTFSAKPIHADVARARRHSEATHLISVYGTDRPGIVYRVAEALAKRRINITDLNTKELRRSGKPLYVMLLEVQIASRPQAAALQKSLKQIGRSLRLDVTVQDIQPIAL